MPPPNVGSGIAAMTFLLTAVKYNFTANRRAKPERTYQILQISDLTIGLPVLHANAEANSGMFDSGPLTR